MIGFNNHKATAMVFVDVVRAFDRVWPDELVHTMVSAGY